MAKGGQSLLLVNVQKMLSHRTTVLLVTAVLAFTVLWQAGGLVWKLWLLSNESPQPRVPVALSTKSAEPEPLINLLRYPLIQSESISTTPGSTSIDAPKTSLKLKLVGLMYSTDENQARAIIESPSDGAGSYATHERVADKTEIYSIEPDRVILLHAGRQEALMLDPEDKKSGVQHDTESQPKGEPNRNQASTEFQSASGQDSANIPKKIADAMRDFSVTPVMADGKLMGYHFARVGSPKIMKEWGIDPNDVITAGNGVPLNTPARVMVLYDKLKKEREFQLTLKNGGNSRTIRVGVDE